MGHSLAFFFIFVFSIKQLVDKFSPMTGFEPRSLVSEATALPIEPQPLHLLVIILYSWELNLFPQAGL